MEQLFIPQTPPDKPTPEELNAYLDRTLRDVAQNFETIADGRTIEKRHVAPSKPRDGMEVYADGTNWDPGSGEGFYKRVAGAWKKTTDALQLSGGTMTGNISMSGTETVDGRDLSVDGAKLDLLAHKNFIINGNLNIWQRGTSFPTSLTQYTADRFKYVKAGVGVVTVTKDTDTPNEYSESSYKVDTTTASGTPAAGDVYYIRQPIEGLNAIPLAFGSADAKTITISFWVKGTKTGIHSVSLRNSAIDRSYIAEYTINVTNTWEKKSVTIAGDTTGTWLRDNGIGVYVNFALASGSTFKTTPGTWQAGNFVASTNQVNALDNIANNFFLSQVKLEIGSVATDFVDRQHGEELALCQRYYEVGDNDSFVCFSVITSQNPSRGFATEKRALPTMTATPTTGSGVTLAGGVNGFWQSVSNSATTNCQWTADAEL